MFGHKIIDNKNLTEHWQAGARRNGEPEREQLSGNKTTSGRARE